MSFFGDFDPDDALDHEPPDPVQVAIKLHRYTREFDPDIPDWDDLSDEEKAIGIAVMLRLISWLRRQGAVR
jgi:hypothetical protein